MKSKRTLKRGLSIVMSFALMLTLLLNVGVLEPKAATVAIYVDGVPLAVDTDVPGDAVYFKNGDAAGYLTGTASDYNAKLENGTNGLVLTLNGLDCGFSASYPVECTSACDLTLVLEGENKIHQEENSYGMIIEFFGLYMPSVNLTIKGSGSLEVASELTTYATGFIKTQDLYITDSAKVDINISKINSGSPAYGVFSTNGVKLDGTSSLSINMGGASDTAYECYGIRANTSSSKVQILDNSNLSITMGGSNNSQYGIECYDFDATTTGTVTINTGKANSNGFGIYANDFDVANSTINVTVEDVSSNNGTGVYSYSDMSLSGKASVNVTMKGGNWPNGIISPAGLTMTDAASIDVNLLQLIITALV